jgi:hypothetical protein
VGYESVGCESVGCELVGCESVGCEPVGCELVGCDPAAGCGLSVKYHDPTYHDDLPGSPSL